MFTDGPGSTHAPAGRASSDRKIEVVLKAFRGSFGVALVGLVVALIYGGTAGLAVAAILAVLEISLSFDNAIVNATVLERMSAFWQRLFLTLGVGIAVVGMRLL